MTKFLVSCMRPALSVRVVTEAPSPEIAAKELYTELHGNVVDVVVTAVGEDADEHVVLDWCTVCRLPVWLDDEVSSYQKQRDEDDIVRLTHVSCLHGVV